MVHVQKRRRDLNGYRGPPNYPNLKQIRKNVQPLEVIMWVNIFFFQSLQTWWSGPVLTFYGPAFKCYVPSSKNNVLVPYKFAKNAYHYLFKLTKF